MKTENKKNNIPESWTMRRLGDVATINPTESLKKGKVTKYVAMENIEPFTRRISNFELKEFNGGMKFRNGDTLFARITPCLENGKTSFVDILENDEIAFGSTEFIVLREKGNLSDKKFLYYLSLSPNLRDIAIRLMTGSSGRQRVQTNLFINEHFIIPPLNEQREIASVLSSFDDKIELLREQNKTLEAIAQAIYKRWFVDLEFPATEPKNSATIEDEQQPKADGVVFNTLQLKGYKSSGGKMVKSELGEIPEGWEVGKIKDLIDILPGFAFSSADFSKEGQYKLVTIKNVQDRYFNPKTKDNLKKLPKKMPDYCILESGDILISLTGNVGRICLANGKDYLLNQRVAKLRPKNENDHAFTYLLFLQDSIFSLIQNTASGTAQQNLSPIQLKEINIIIADRKILDKFGTVANKLIKKIKNNISQIQTLSALRDSLLPKLMSGKIRVPVKNEAETTPASYGCHPSLKGGELEESGLISEKDEGNK